MALPRIDRRDLILELPVPRQQRVELVALGLPGHDAFLSGISLFDGLPITQIDGLPTSASRLL
jgi:hypothetical protein